MRVAILLIFAFLLSNISYGQINEDTFEQKVAQSQFERGKRNVNKCTPIDHFKCIYITGAEVLEDGLQGKAARHWWRMSYIGQACTEQYGNTFGYAFEGFFAIPHYLSMGIFNGGAYVVSLFKVHPEKRQLRRARRAARRENRSEKRKLLQE